MRSDARWLLIEAALTLRGYLPIAVGWSTFGHRMPGWPSSVLEIAVWAYLILRPLSIVVSWLTTRYWVDERGARLRLGVLVHEEVEASWADIVSIDVTQPYLHRMLGCHTVRVGLGSGERTQLTVGAVSAPVAERIVQLSRARVRAAEAGPSSRPQPVPADDRAMPHRGDLLYRIRPVDHLLMAATWGQAVMFVPFLLATADELAGWLGVELPGWSELSRLTPTTLAGLALAVLIGSAGYATAISWLRYRGFQVTAQDGGFTISGGLIARQTRHIQPGEAVGLVVSQNPLMRVTGYARISLVTRDRGAQPTANVIFPVIRLSGLSAALRRHFPGWAALAAPHRVSPAAMASASVLVLTGALAAVAAVRAFSPGLLAVAAAAGAPAAVLVFNALLVTIDLAVDPGRPGAPQLVCQRGWWWRSRRILRAEAIQVIAEYRGPLGRLTHHSTLVAHYTDGRSRRLRAFGVAPARWIELRAAVLAAIDSPPTTRQAGRPGSD